MNFYWKMISLAVTSQIPRRSKDRVPSPSDRDVCRTDGKYSNLLSREPKPKKPKLLIPILIETGFECYDQSEGKPSDVDVDNEMENTRTVENQILLPGRTGYVELENKGEPSKSDYIKVRRSSRCRRKLPDGLNSLPFFKKNYRYIKC